MSIYKVIGRPSAGSLIAEFLLTEAKQKYEFKFISPEECNETEFLKLQPFGKIPVLVCPDGNSIFETMAITTHLIEKFPQLAPPKDSYKRDLQWQYLSLMGTSIYLAYHRQFYTRYYAPEDVSKEVGKLASDQREIGYSYLEKALCPYLLGDKPMAVDFYLFMITRWDPNIKVLLENKPKLSEFIKNMKSQDAVVSVLNSHK